MAVLSVFPDEESVDRSSWVDAISSLPVDRVQAAKSLTDPGSVARTSTVFPASSRSEQGRGLDDRHRAAQAAGVNLVRGGVVTVMVVSFRSFSGDQMKVTGPSPAFR